MAELAVPPIRSEPGTPGGDGNLSWLPARPGGTSREFVQFPLAGRRGRPQIPSAAGLRYLVMKALTYSEFGAPLRCVDMPDPVAGPGGVVVRVRATGVCRSDWHAWQGHDADIRSLPHVPGHEFAGEIVALGAGVSRLRVGQRITVPFACGCGAAACPECRAGHAQVCPQQYQPGFSGPGAFADFVAVPAAEFNAVALPDEISYAAAAALGCRFATAWRALAHEDQAHLQPGETMVVFGCGGVGLSAVMIGAALGARVLAVDPRPAARARAVDVGAQAAAEPEDAAAFVREHTAGRGADLSVEAVGRADACTAALHCLRPRGRMVQIGLLMGAHADPRLPMGAVIARELRILGSHGMAAAAYPELLAMLAAGRLHPEQLVAQRIGFLEIGDALDAMTRNAGAAGTVIAEW